MDNLNKINNNLRKETNELKERKQESLNNISKLIKQKENVILNVENRERLNHKEINVLKTKISTLEDEKLKLDKKMLILQNPELRKNQKDDLIKLEDRLNNLKFREKELNKQLQVNEFKLDKQTKKSKIEKKKVFSSYNELFNEYTSKEDVNDKLIIQIDKSKEVIEDQKKQLNELNIL